MQRSPKNAEPHSTQTIFSAALATMRPLIVAHGIWAAGRPPLVWPCSLACVYSTEFGVPSLPPVTAEAAAAGDHPSSLVNGAPLLPIVYNTRYLFKGGEVDASHAARTWISCELMNASQYVWYGNLHRARPNTSFACHAAAMRNDRWRAFLASLARLQRMLQYVIFECVRGKD